MHEQQYNAVVAQNNSLQGELRLYKKMVRLILKDHLFFCDDPSKEYEIVYPQYKNKALQELEAKNG